MPKSKARRRSAGRQRGPSGPRAPGPSPRRPADAVGGLGPAARARAARARFGPASWPAWAYIWVAVTVLLLFGRAAGILTSLPLTVFLSAGAAAAIQALTSAGQGYGPTPTLLLRRVVLALLFVLVPVLVDPTTVETVNLPRSFLLELAAVLVVGSWVLDGAWTRRRPGWVNGLQWPILAVIAWAGVSSAFSLLPRVALLGAYSSYEGLGVTASLVVLAFGYADSFGSSEIVDLLRLLVVGSAPVLLYALIQMHDKVLGGHWDFVRWKATYHNVFATFGNPNHLAGYLSVVLPVAVVLALASRDRWNRFLYGAAAALAALVVLQTAARGAWLAVMTGVVLVGLALGVQPAQRKRLGVAAAAGLSGIVLLLALGAQQFIGAKVAALFAVGGNSSASQRIGYWRAAIDIGLRHPVAGTGPDTYSVIYGRYQSASLARAIKGFFINGPHNLFMDALANQGFIGLILLVVLLASAFWFLVRTWVTSRRAGAGSGAATATDSARVALSPAIAAVALAAALLSYVVQASFDTAQVATSFVFWALLGAAGVLARGAWSTSSLQRFPWRALDPITEDVWPEDGVASLNPDAGRRSSRRSRRRPAVPARAVVAGGVAFLVGGLALWQADLPWRADHAEWAAGRLSSSGGTLTPAQDAQLTQDLNKAHGLNPWQPTYLEGLGQLAYATYARSPASPAGQADLVQAVAFFGQAAQLDQYDSDAEGAYGAALLVSARAHVGGASRSQAVRVLRRAVVDNPFNTQAQGLLSKARS